MTQTSQLDVDKVEIRTEDKETTAVHFLHLSSSPHLRHPQTVSQIMKKMIIGLIPAIIAALVFFNAYALTLIFLSAITAVTTEWLFCIIRKRPSTINDFSAIVTGLLVGLGMPPAAPWWIAVIGSFFAIAVIKIAFGGLGNNIFNPACAALAFLIICFPDIMTKQWLAPSWGSLIEFDSITSATPLLFFKDMALSNSLDTADIKALLLPMFLGNVGGCIGETSVVALIIGAIWLWNRGVIGFKIPLTYICTVFILFWLTSNTGCLLSEKALLIPVYQILAGSLMLGALYMANDTVTSPITPVGKLLFGIGCGALTFVIRKYSNFPEGVCFAILIMNLLVPIIERYTKPKVYGS